MTAAPPSRPARPPLLAVEDLSVAVATGDGREITVVDDMSFAVDRGDTLGIVGESGSGKSMLSLAIMGLLPDAARASGHVRLDGDELIGKPDTALDRIRGRRIGMIFQEPATALNPSMRVGDQIAEALTIRHGIGWGEARERAVALIERVRIADPARRARAYPHELSGGQRQRIGIAIALAAEPALIIADEPTTALDVTVQAEILDLIAELVAERGMALILISHDLGVVARATRRLVVMYAGTRVEQGPTAAVLADPLSPYTRGLVASMPTRRPDREARLPGMIGTTPAFDRLPAGCRFAPRCPMRVDACVAGEPVWRDLGQGRGVRCVVTEWTGAGAPEPTAGEGPR